MEADKRIAKVKEVQDSVEAARAAEDAIGRLAAAAGAEKKHHDMRGRRKPPERKRRRLEVQASRRANRGLRPTGGRK